MDIEKNEVVINDIPHTQFWKVIQIQWIFPSHDYSWVKVGKGHSAWKGGISSRKFIFNHV